MNKIIFLFLMFSAMLFAKWQVGALHTDNETATTFTTYDNQTESILIIAVVLEDYNGYSFVVIKNSKIKEEDNLMLVIKDNDGDNINYSIYSGDIMEEGMALIIGEDAKRGNLLTKMLYKGQSAKLYNYDTDELLATFDLKGIKQIIQKHVGSSYWYKYKLNSIYD